MKTALAEIFLAVLGPCIHLQSQTLSFIFLSYIFKILVEFRLSEWDCHCSLGLMAAGEMAPVTLSFFLAVCHHKYFPKMPV